MTKICKYCTCFPFKFFRFLYNSYNCSCCCFSGRKQCETCKRVIVDTKNDILCVSCKNSTQQWVGGTENLEIALQLIKRDPSSGEDVEQSVSDCNEQISVSFLPESKPKIEPEMGCSNKHEISIPIQYIYNCHICDKSYARQSHLNAHLNNIHAHTRFPCSACPKTFVSERELNIHFGIYHMCYKYKCNRCDKRFCSMSGYRSHYETIHLEIHHLCDFCDKCYKSLGSLHWHMRNKHINKGMVYTCRCGKTYSSPGGLRAHQRYKDHL